MLELPPSSRVTRSFEPSGDQAPSSTTPGPGTTRVTWRLASSIWKRCGKCWRYEVKRMARASGRQRGVTTRERSSVTFTGSS